MTRLVDLADEFDLTTSDALELCDELGIPVDTAASELDDEQADLFRAVVLAGPAEAQKPEFPGLRPPSSSTDFSKVPDAWHKAARTPPPPEPGSGPTERRAVWALVLAVISVGVSLVTGLCGALFAFIALGMSVNARKAIDAKRTKGRFLVTLAHIAVVVAFVVAAAVTWIAWSGNADQLPTVAALDAVAPGEFHKADTLEAGECLVEPALLPGARELQLVQVVPCDDDHDVEIVERLDQYGISAVEDLDDYPGEEEIEQYMPSACEGPWELFVGSDLGSSELELFLVYPTARAWDGGDRGMFCGVASADGSTLTGTTEGSER